MQGGAVMKKSIFGKTFLIVALLLLSILTIAEVKPGDVVTYGAIEQDGNIDNGPEPIEWYVLGTKGNSTLLFSKYALMPFPYSQNDPNANWENCDLRAYLNDHNLIRSATTMTEYINLASFSISTKALESMIGEEITTKTLKTLDNIFLLSQEEVEQYLTEDMYRAPVTPYAAACGAYQEDGMGIWWLRDSLGEKYGALTGWADGTLSYCDATYKMICVRPAIYVFSSVLDNAKIVNTDNIDNSQKEEFPFTCSIYLAEYDSSNNIVREIEGNSANFDEIAKGNKLGIGALIENTSDKNQAADISCKIEGENDKNWNGNVIGAGKKGRLAVVYSVPFDGNKKVVWYINGTVVAEEEFTFCETAVVLPVKEENADLTYETEIIEFDESYEVVKQHGLYADFAALPKGHHLGYSLVIENRGAEDVYLEIDPVANGEKDTGWTDVLVPAGEKKRVSAPIMIPYEGYYSIEWYVDGESACIETFLFENNAIEASSPFLYEMHVATFDDEKKFSSYSDNDMNFATLDEGFTLGVVLVVTNTEENDLPVDISLLLDGEAYKWGEYSVKGRKSVRFEIRFEEPFEGDKLVVWKDGDETVYEDVLSFRNSFMNSAMSISPVD